MNYMSSYVRKRSLYWYFVEKRQISGIDTIKYSGMRGISVVRHFPLVLEVPGLIPARGEENFGVRIRFL